MRRRPTSLHKCAFFFPAVQRSCNSFEPLKESRSRDVVSHYSINGASPAKVAHLVPHCDRNGLKSSRLDCPKFITPLRSVPPHGGGRQGKAGPGPPSGRSCWSGNPLACRAFLTCPRSFWPSMPTARPRVIRGVRPCDTSHDRRTGDVPHPPVSRSAQEAQPPAEDDANGQSATQITEPADRPERSRNGGRRGAGDRAGPTKATRKRPSPMRRPQKREPRGASDDVIVRQQEASELARRLDHGQFGPLHRIGETIGDVRRSDPRPRVRSVDGGHLGVGGFLGIGEKKIAGQLERVADRLRRQRDHHATDPRGGRGRPGIRVPGPGGATASPTRGQCRNGHGYGGRRRRPSSGGSASGRAGAWRRCGRGRRFEARGALPGRCGAAPAAPFVKTSASGSRSRRTSRGRWTCRRSARSHRRANRFSVTLSRTLPPMTPISLPQAIDHDVAVRCAPSLAAGGGIVPASPTRV